jgi:hypothetical protein
MLDTLGNHRKVYMETHSRVVLYGKTLVLAGVEASLRAYPTLEVISLDVCDGVTIQELCAYHADVLIFDVAAVPPEFPFSLLCEQPELRLVGLDAAGDKSLLLSGRQARSMTTGQLVQIIETEPEQAPSLVLNFPEKGSQSYPPSHSTEVL